MALGDKLPVVMGKEKAVANGVATLDSDGKLAKSQRPTPTEAGSADLTLSNLSNYQTALRNIGGRPNRNLLDNAYFKGGGSQQGGGQFPINQRGQTSYNASGGTIDRWVLGSGPATGGTAVTLSADGLILNGNTQYQYTLIRQTLSAPVLSNQVYTLSALLANGTLVQNSGQSTAEDVDWCNLQITPTCYIRAVGLNKVELVETAETPPIKALKMEAGDHQTLAYQDESGAWQLFETPDYGEELAKCQRYFYKYVGNVFLCNYAAGEGYASFEFPVEMRITPTVTIDSYNPDWGVPDARSINSHGLVFHSTSNGGIVTQFTASAEL